MGRRAGRGQTWVVINWKRKRRNAFWTGAGGGDDRNGKRNASVRSQAEEGPREKGPRFFLVVMGAGVQPHIQDHGRGRRERVRTEKIRKKKNEKAEPETTRRGGSNVDNGISQKQKREEKRAPGRILFKGRKSRREEGRAGSQEKVNKSIILNHRL